MRYGPIACVLRLALAALAACALPAAQLCTPHWLDEFDPQALGGTLLALQSFDDGQGARLYGGGAFTSTNSPNIARWDGTQWSALPAGLDGDVRCLTVHDDGSGPALYAGGLFLNAGGVAAAHVARWNGASWSPLATGIDGPVHALCSYDDGTGPALYAGGAFAHAGGVAAKCVARWSGGQWSGVGGGVAHATIAPAVHALLAHDDGGGLALFAAGVFTTAGGVTATNLARWRQGTWSPLGTGSNSPVQALARFPLGGTMKLVTNRNFGVPFGGVAAWDGSGWTSLGGAFAGGTVRAFAVDASTPGSERLYACGTFAGLDGSKISVYDGTQWSPVGVGLAPASSAAYAAAFYAAPGASSELCVGGSFDSAGGFACAGFARWTGTQWILAGNAVSDDVRALLRIPLPAGGEELYVGGDFDRVGALPAARIARWDGSTWQALGAGMNAPVNALCTMHQGGASWIVAGGSFSTAGGVSASRVAGWDGNAWAPFGGGLVGTVYALAVHDYGSGPQLFAGGLNIGVMRWDGATWNYVGVGLASSSIVYALATFNDGAGPRLFAGGDLTVYPTGFPTGTGLAAWDGAVWQGFGTTSSGTQVRALEVATLGTQPLLYIGGGFTALCGAPIQRIGSYDGTSFQQVGTGCASGTVKALRAVEFGGKPRLVAGGSMPNELMQWDGAAWSAGLGDPDGAVEALAEFEPAGVTSKSLVAGGSFFAISGVVSPHFGAYRECKGFPLDQSVTEVSVASGGVATWTLSAGAGFAGAPYWLLGSLSGWSPGITVNGWTLPLVVDPLFEFTLAHPNTGWYVHNHAFVAPNGTDFARLVVPAGAPAALIGAHAYHAYFVYDVFLGVVVLTSNAVQLDFVP